MFPPKFWDQRGPLSSFLVPVSWVYNSIRVISKPLHHPITAPVPVLCVGNLNIGGSGKTPVAISIGQKLKRAGYIPHFLTRGYGGNLKKPTQVDPSHHTARDVGDEPLLLSNIAPVWIGANRASSAALACAAGADFLIMDDGFQNLSLKQDLSLLVIDGETGFGNGRVIPAGPLREDINSGIKRADAIVLIGDDTQSITQNINLPILKARMQPANIAGLQGEKFVAFAGIGRPKKFFDTLRKFSCDLILEREFPDHHHFTHSELEELLTISEQCKASLITTEKDFVRIPGHFRSSINVLKIEIEWIDPNFDKIFLKNFLKI
tara:strand:+ start:2763 stop:3725 length:963 start_codon:yes stop_codon:yes gene_type:complete